MKRRKAGKNGALKFHDEADGKRREPRNKKRVQRRVSGRARNAVRNNKRLRNVRGVVAAWVR